MKQFLLVAIFLSANNFVFAADKRPLFLKGEQFYFISIEIPDSEINDFNDFNRDISAGFLFVLSSHDYDPIRLGVGLCRTFFQLNVDIKLPLIPGDFSGFIRISPASRIMPYKNGWPAWYQFTDGEVFINFPTVAEKVDFEKYLAERMKKYCPKPLV